MFLNIRMVAFAAAIFVSLFLGSCAPKSKNQVFPPVILDSANILSSSDLLWLKSYQYPAGYNFIIQSVDKIPLHQISKKPDELFNDLAVKCPDVSTCQQAGVYILITRNPPLIQTRIGTSHAYMARMKGVTAGNYYIDIQNIAVEGNFSEATKKMVEWTATTLPKVEMTLLQKMVFMEAYSELFIELDEIGLPSDTFFGNVLVKPILKMRTIEYQLLKTWWVTYILVAIVLILVEKLTQKILTGTIGRINLQAGNIISSLVGIVFNLIYALPSASTVLLLSGSRLEDRLALSAGIGPSLETFTFNAHQYLAPTGLLLALLVFGVRWLGILTANAGGFAYAHLPDWMQTKLFDKLLNDNPLQVFAYFPGVNQDSEEGFIGGLIKGQPPFTAAISVHFFFQLKRGFYWAVFSLLFLPQAVTVVLLIMWTAQALKGIANYILAKKSIAPLLNAQGAG